jgi:hypothetical protein
MAHSLEHLGTKHLCNGCGTRFYDLHHLPVACPKCHVSDVQALRHNHASFASSLMQNTDASASKVYVPSLDSPYAMPALPEFGEDDSESEYRTGRSNRFKASEEDEGDDAAFIAYFEQNGHHSKSIMDRE